jgi:hypothetical protein
MSAPGRYSVYVTATGKRTAKDLYLAGSCVVPERTWEHPNKLMVSGGPGNKGINLTADLAALTEAKSATQLVGAIREMADILIDVFDSRHEEQIAFSEKLQEFHADIVKEREQMLGIVSERSEEKSAWEEAKVEMLKKAPEQALELVGMVGGLLKSPEKEDDLDV